MRPTLWQALRKSAKSCFPVAFPRTQMHFINADRRINGVRLRARKAGSSTSSGEPRTIDAVVGRSSAPKAYRSAFRVHYRWHRPISNLYRALSLTAGMKMSQMPLSRWKRITWRRAVQLLNLADDGNAVAHLGAHTAKRTPFTPSNSAKCAPKVSIRTQVFTFGQQPGIHVLQRRTEMIKGLLQSLARCLPV